MKYLKMIGILLFVSSNAHSAPMANENNLSKQVETVAHDSVLINIQSKIYNAFVKSLRMQSLKPLADLDQKLVTFNKERQHPLPIYWRSYLQFYASVYYLKMGDRQKAEKEIDKGIVYLTSLEIKDSEAYALLAKLQTFNLQFKTAEAAQLSAEIKCNANLSIAKDSNNLRAYYAYASIDFYTPTQYGGGRQAESYLLKAIALPEQATPSIYLPSWGKEAAYVMLVKLYVKQHKKAKAKTYLEAGKAAYPNSYSLQQLSIKR